MRKRYEIGVLVGILALGAILRICYLRELDPADASIPPEVDAGYHDYFARALITGNWTPPPSEPDPQIRTTPYFRPPGYPIFLSIVYRLTGGSYLGARLFQMGLGLACALFAYIWGRRFHGGRVGLLFAGLLATYWGFIYFEGDFLEPALLSTLSMLLLWDLGGWTEQVTFRRSLRSGVLLGLAVLVRPNVLLFAPFLAFWAFRFLRGRRQWLAVVLAVSLATLLTIAPATVRNYVVARDFVLISSNAGINLFIGNNPEANGTVSPTIPGVGTFGSSFEYPRLVRAVEEKVGRPLKHSQVSAYFSARAFQHMKAHPLDTAGLLLQKALLFWGPLEVGNNKEEEIDRSQSPVLRSLPLRFAGAAAMCLLGILTLARSWRNETPSVRREVMIVALFILASFLSYLPYFVAGRFRTPLVPFLLFFGALGLDRLLQLAHTRRWKHLWLGLVGLALLYAVTSRNFSGYRPTWEKWHFDRGLLLARTNRIDEAIGEYEQALRDRDDDAPTHFNLGALYESQGQMESALPHYQAALRSDPQFGAAHHALARHHSQVGERDLAAQHYRSALSSAPSPQLFVDYAGVLIQQKRDADAEAAYGQALSLNPGYVPAPNNLAVLLFMKGDYPGAWQQVSLCRMYGGNPPEGFLRELERRSPEAKVAPPPP